MKKPLVSGLESVAFSGEGARERAIEKMQHLAADGVKHVTRRTDSIQPPGLAADGKAFPGQTIYIVSWPTAEDQRTVLAEAEQFVKSMENEGGNANVLDQ